jgi:hypothetical protein
MTLQSQLDHKPQDLPLSGIGVDTEIIAIPQAESNTLSNYPRFSHRNIPSRLE